MKRILLLLIAGTALLFGCKKELPVNRFPLLQSHEQKVSLPKLMGPATATEQDLIAALVTEALEEEYTAFDRKGSQLQFHAKKKNSTETLYLDSTKILQTVAGTSYTVPFAQNPEDKQGFRNLIINKQANGTLTQIAYYE